MNQSRARVGLGRVLNATPRLDVGYMVRSREVSTSWVHDHVLNLYVFLDVAKPTDAPKPP